MNKKTDIIVATIKSWNIDDFHKIKEIEKEYNWIIIEKKKDLNYENIKSFNPKYIFFPHWSWIIPKEIYKNFECIVFHMTDLPFGRGGSPLQNLISRGIYKTKISALQVVEELDAGNIYCKESLILNEGNAEEIFKRSSEIIFSKIIPFILKNNPIPQPQIGEIVSFKRRTPEQSNITNLFNLNQIYDYIRMLDAEGYPSAFIETAKLKIQFKKARKYDKIIQAECIIEVKDDK